MDLNSICYLIAGCIGFIIGYIFRGIAEWYDRNDGERHGDMVDDIYDRVVERQMAGIELELEEAILDWVRDEYPGYSLMILENPDDSGVKLVTIYDVDDSQIAQTTRRIWEIINLCENDYNVDIRRKFTYVPNVHTHTNTARFFKQYLREKKDDGEQV